MKQDYLIEIRRLYDDDKYDAAFHLAEEAERVGEVSPALLVWKSRSLLLSDQPPVSADEVERWLYQALALDEEYVPALVELGYYLLNVKDDAAAALPVFKRALTIVLENATELVLGLAECISETDSANAAVEFLDKNRSPLNASKLEALKLRLAGSANED